MNYNSQDRDKVIKKIEQLIKGRKNAAYQYIVLEGILRGLEEQPLVNKIPIQYIFKNFAQIAYILHKVKGIHLGGDTQNISGKASANGIINSFVEKYNLYDVCVLDEKQLSDLTSKMSSIKKAPIDAITKEEVGLFSKVSSDGEEFIAIDEQVKKVILKNIELIRLTNEEALYRYLQTIPSNHLSDVIRFKELLSRDCVQQREEGEKVNEKKEYKEDELIKSIHHYIECKGFTYSLQMIQNLYLSLKTKPFTILAGISGTGKTKIVELFAEAIGATTENGRYKLIAVRPDWSDSTELLGYRDLNNQFNPGILTCVASKALKHPDEPYFICLDEMNLARVEYYLSDFLSVIESRKKVEDRIITQPLLHESVIGEDEGARACYGKIYIPDNLYIVGTVNMDETTYPFSKKVLDRVNTVEFSEVNLMSGLEALEQIFIEPVESVGNEFMKSEFLHLADCRVYKTMTRKVVKKLEQINRILEQAHLQFAYRVRDEIVFYMLYNEHFGLMREEEAFDLQLLQKVLPRLAGSNTKLEKVLEQLKQYTEESYPKAYAKLEFMIERYNEDGFTSYWM